MVRDLILENKKPIELVQEIEFQFQTESEIRLHVKELEIPNTFPSQEKIKKSITGIISENLDHTSYIGSLDSNIWTELDKNIISNRHSKVSPFNHFCLGCLLAGGKYSGESELNFTKTFQFSGGGRLVLETSESGTQELIIPSQGGVVKLEVKGNGVSLALEDNQNLQQLQGEKVNSVGKVSIYAPEERERKVSLVLEDNNLQKTWIEAE